MATITVVEKGEYDDFDILAAFEDADDAQAFADDYNDEHKPDWPMRARVGTLDFYRAGAYMRRGQVIDGETVVVDAIGC